MFEFDALLNICIRKFYRVNMRSFENQGVPLRRNDCFQNEFTPLDNPFKQQSENKKQISNGVNPVAKFTPKGTLLGRTGV